MNAHLVPFIVDGLLIGFVYGIAAMGMTLIWGVMKVINLAHGALIALGSFGVYLLFVSGLHIHPYLGLLLVAGIGLDLWDPDLLSEYSLDHQCPIPFDPAGNVRDQHDHHWAGHRSIQHQSTHG